MSPEESPAANVRAAEVVLPCRDLATTLAFFTERLGFRLEAIQPADDPTSALLGGYGLRLRLERDADVAPGLLRLTCKVPQVLAQGAHLLVAPNGTRIELVEADPELVVPPRRSTFGVTRAKGDCQWGEGRAGMLYRDLVPERVGGYLVASHISIPEGGPVPDFVHFHEVRFQVIYCHRGWVRLVYEDQGPPFVLAEGDCVLQPPTIRHRVLESSPGLEVVELVVPAAHATRLDHELALPSPEERPEREFGGQRFVRHERAKARWAPWHRVGFEASEVGIEAATRGLARVQVVRVAPASPAQARPELEALRFFFVRSGTALLEAEGHPGEALAEGDAVLLPAGQGYSLREVSADLELLEAAFP